MFSLPDPEHAQARRWRLSRAMGVKCPTSKRMEWIRVSLQCILDR